MATESATPELHAHPRVIRQAIDDRGDALGLIRRYRDRLNQLQIEHDYTDVPGVGHEPIALIRGLAEAHGRFG
ncbi:MAG: hypothetical protein ACKOFK_05195 [Betaproteobacteria bacterium]